jgi:PAS domain S-box-containing protein
MSAIPQRTVRERSTDHALACSERLFRKVVEAAPGAMVLVGEDGLIAMVNAQAERVFGYAREELLNRPVEMLTPQRFRQNHPALRGLYRTEARSRPLGGGRGLYGLRKDGSEFPVEIGLDPIETEDGVMILSTIADISERRQREGRLEAALKEKEILLGEVHHRVKNNLQIIQSLLHLQAAKVKDRSLSQLLNECQNRIRSMALIHQTLYQSNDFARVDFHLFLDTLAPTLVSSYGADPGRIGLSIEASDVSLPIDAAIPCGLIVNELISNALKHAFPNGRRGRIAVEMTRTVDHWVTLSILDDGVGLPGDVDLARARTLGLQLVWLLSDQLGATLDVNRSTPTRFQLSFSVGS